MNDLFFTRHFQNSLTLSLLFFLFVVGTAGGERVEEKEEKEKKRKSFLVITSREKKKRAPSFGRETQKKRSKLILFLKRTRKKRLTNSNYLNSLNSLSHSPFGRRCCYFLLAGEKRGENIGIVFGAPHALRKSER